MIKNLKYLKNPAELHYFCKNRRFPNLKKAKILQSKSLNYLQLKNVAPNGLLRLIFQEIYKYYFTFGPAFTSALPASFVSYLLKFLMNNEAKF